MKYSPAEAEVIGLCIALEALNTIANKAMLELAYSSETPGEATAWFNTSIHRDLFLIRLLDFVKEGSNGQLTGVAGSCLHVLRSATQTASFNIGDSIAGLDEAISEMEAWLAHSQPVNLWLPTLDVQANLNMSRIELLTISGNQSKHNLSRLSGIVYTIATRLREHGHDVDDALIPLALEDFQGHLSENYFAYYGTWLAELVNNIRWGIYTYLQPTFQNSYKRDPNPDSPHYHFEYPPSIEQEIPRQWFWRQMNAMRRPPYLNRFKCSKSLRQASSLEWP